MDKQSEKKELTRCSRVLLCSIAYMKEYKGIDNADMPHSSVEYVETTGNATEKYNFLPCNDGMVRGYVSTKHRVGWNTPGRVPNQIRIERIDKNYKNKEAIDDVLVVFFATHEKEKCMVGWYEHATVLRHRKEFVRNGESIPFSVLTIAGNEYLIPEGKRNYIIGSAKKGEFGFGQANIRYINTPEGEKEVNKIIAYIKSVKAEKRY